MDTSTISFEDAQSPPVLAIAHKTASVQTDAAHPAAADWFTRLIAPLTHSSPVSLAAPAASEQPQAPIAHVKSFWAGGDIYVDEQGNRPPSMQAPYPGTGSGGGGTVGTTPHQGEQRGLSTVLLIFIPVLVVVITVLVGLLCFLIAVLLMRRRKGVRLTEDGGPLDLSKSDGVIGEGGVEGVESRWLETVEPDVRAGYARAKDWQEQYPPSSVPTDITLSQFLSIQEKGVSAWAFEPDYEDNLSLYVQSRTEITFLSDGPGMPAREGGGNTVMANLPLPKLNEVYYWEVKMFDKPPSTEVAIGLATKPYPSFRLPGWNRHSVAYFASDGFKSHNYPFTAASHGPPLHEGDVLGVGYRPRTGTVFFTRNGRKMDDAYTGLQRLNLFPTIGANGPCTVHVNLGQAGFVFIEANVKKWGLAPMTGTLAPPPAYGSERGSILLDAGYGTPGAHTPGASGQGMSALLEAARARAMGSSGGIAQPISPGRSSQSSRRHRRAGRSANLSSSIPAHPSPLRASEAGPGPSTAGSRRRVLGRTRAPAIGPGEESPAYVSPTDTPEPGPRGPDADALEQLLSDEEYGSDYESAESGADDASEAPSSPLEHNPPTPNLLDISMHSLHLPGHYFGRARQGAGGEEGPVTPSRSGSGSASSDETARPSRVGVVSPSRAGANGAGNGDSPPPPGYAPLDPNVYAGGLPADLPEEMVNQAIAAMAAAEGNNNTSNSSNNGNNAGVRSVSAAELAGDATTNSFNVSRGVSGIMAQLPWPFAGRQG